MAAELITPTDEFTGFPLPIIPSRRLMDGEPIFTNWHHSYHPNSSQALQGLGGRALRHSRIQLVDASNHNHSRESYHAIYKGFDMPDVSDLDGQFRLALLGITGYIPRQGIDMESPSYGVRDLTEQEVVFLRQPAAIAPVTNDQLHKFIEGHDDCSITPKKAWRTLHHKRKRQAAMSYDHIHYSYDATRTFFSDYVLSEERLDVSPKIVHRFMGALALEQYERAIGFGELIIQKATEATVEPIRPIFRELHSQGLLHRLVPADPAKIVKHKLGDHKKRQELLHNRLKKISDLAAA